MFKNFASLSSNIKGMLQIVGGWKTLEINTKLIITELTLKKLIN